MLKKIRTVLICLLLSAFANAQKQTPEVQKILDEINGYLKAEKGNTISSIDITDGQFIAYTSPGFFKTNMSDIDKAVLQTTDNNKYVELLCKSKSKCFTRMSPSGTFESIKFTHTSKLLLVATALNKLPAAYAKNSKPGVVNEEDEILFDVFTGEEPKQTAPVEADKFKSNKNNKKNETIINKYDTTTASYKKLIATYNELNAHLPSLDGGRYLGIEVKDGYIISHYSNNNSSKAKIEDIGYVKGNKEYNYVKLACNNDSKCVYSSITNQYHDYFNFNVSASTLEKTVTLLNNFLESLKSYLASSNSGTSVNRGKSNNE